MPTDVGIQSGGEAAGRSRAPWQSKRRSPTTVPLSWNEVYFTNCPMVSANNVDQELGWCREEFKKIGVEYAYFRSRPENNWYPHYIHNLDNLIRFGGLYPPIAVHADIRRTRLLGATEVYEGGAMMVRARDDIFKMTDLRGKKVGLTKSLNTIKNDWWRIQEHAGIELMLRINGMTMDDVEIVEFPYPDDWYDKPEMLQVSVDARRSFSCIVTASTTWRSVLSRRHSKTSLWMRCSPRARSSSIFRRPRANSRPSRTCPVTPTGRCRNGKSPAVIACTDVMAEENLRSRGGLHEGHDQGRPLGQRAQTGRRSDS